MSPAPTQRPRRLRPWRSAGQSGHRPGPSLGRMAPRRELSAADWRRTFPGSRFHVLACPPSLHERDFAQIHPAVDPVRVSQQHPVLAFLDLAHLMAALLYPCGDRLAGCVFLAGRLYIVAHLDCLFCCLLDGGVCLFLLGLGRFGGRYFQRRGVHLHAGGVWIVLFELEGERRQPYAAGVVSLYAADGHFPELELRAQLPASQIEIIYFCNKRFPALDLCPDVYASPGVQRRGEAEREKLGASFVGGFLFLGGGVIVCHLRIGEAEVLKGDDFLRAHGPCFRAPFCHCCHAIPP